MLMMLGRMDGKLDSVLSQLATNIAKTNELDQRVGKLEGSMAGREPLVEQHKNLIRKVEGLETWRSEIAGGTKGMSLAGNIGKVLIGAAIPVLGYLGVTLTHTPKPVAKSEVTIERSIQLPPPTGAP